MNILNAKYKTQPMKWDSITFPLVQGTPINVDGEISNDEDAIGMVTETFTERPLLPALSIVIAGDIEAKEIVYELSDAAVAAMSGIRIFKADGSRESSGGSGASFSKHLIQLHLIEYVEGLMYKVELRIELLNKSGDEITNIDELRDAVKEAIMTSISGECLNESHPVNINPTSIYVENESLFVIGGAGDGTDTIYRFSGAYLSTFWTEETGEPEVTDTVTEV